MRFIQGYIFGGRGEGWSPSGPLLFFFLISILNGWRLRVFNKSYTYTLFYHRLYWTTWRLSVSIKYKRKFLIYIFKSPSPLSENEISDVFGFIRNQYNKLMIIFLSNYGENEAFDINYKMNNVLGSEITCK